jgi:carboxyl-terminal processing protease
MQRMRSPLKARLLRLALAACTVGAVTLSTVGSAGAQTPDDADEFGPAQKDAILTQVQDHIARRVYVHGVEFGEWPRHVARYANAIEDAQTPDQFARALNEALERFGISHAGIVPPRMARDIGGVRAGEIGIGVSLRPASGGGLRVIGVPDDSGAKGLLNPGDVILTIDGKRAKDEADLAGEVDSVAVLRVRRVKGGTTDEVRVARKARAPEFAPVGFRLIDDDAAYISIATFADGYDEATIAQRFEEIKGRSHLVLDLRGNGGGRVTNFLHLLGFFFEPGTRVGIPVGSEDAAKFVLETGQPPSDAFLVAAWMKGGYTIEEDRAARFNGSVAVLIDGGSASASECTASALRELRRAPLVGSRSAGALLVSRFLALPGGFAMQAPVMDYITVRGFRPEGVGLAPDIEVRSRDQEAAVTAALERLRRHTP